MKRDLSALFEKSLEPSRLDLLRRVADLSTALGLPLYIVGGFVRDLIVGRAGADFDLVVEGDAAQLAGALVRKYGGRLVLHSKFRTAKWFLPKAESSTAPLATASFLDLVSARSETYKHPGALPSVKPGTLDQDIFRRDFTINTLALRLDGGHFGELHDDLNALDDLEAGLVRVLHPRSFLDDPTRMFRAVRYEQRYGFRIADDTLALLPAARPLTEELSAQRVRHELDLILEEPGAGSMLERLAELDLLRPVHPALTVDSPALARIRRANDPALKPETLDLPLSHLRWLLWLMGIGEEKIRSINGRLHFTALLLASLKGSSLLLAELPSYVSLKPSQWAGRLEKYPLDAIYAVSLAVPGRELKQYLAEWRHVKPHATGHDLKQRGLKPGPKYQSILQSLRNAWLDGQVMSAREEEQLLDSLLPARPRKHAKAR